MIALQFDETGDTWFSVNKLEDKNNWERYLRSIYMVINVVATIGYGDMYPCTTLERAFYMALCTSGDVLFALTFGLLASLSLQRAADDEIQMFIEKMCET